MTNKMTAHIYAVYITRSSLKSVNYAAYASTSKSFCIDVFNKELDAAELIKRLKVVLHDCKFYKLKLECL